MTEYPMTEKWLTVWLADEFHDWIDGDDPVAGYKRQADNSIDVTFESGARFRILVDRLPPLDNEGDPLRAWNKPEGYETLSEQLGTSGNDDCQHVWGFDGALVKCGLCHEIREDFEKTLDALGIPDD